MSFLNFYNALFKEYLSKLTIVKFTPKKRENAKIDFRVVNFMKFLEREIFEFSRFRVQLHNAKNLSLSYKTIKIKIKIYN